MLEKRVDAVRHAECSGARARQSASQQRSPRDPLFEGDGAPKSAVRNRCRDPKIARAPRHTRAQAYALK